MTTASTVSANQPIESTWPRTAPPPLVEATLRARPEDFVVREILPVEPGGDGEHLWVRVRKRGINTDQVARWLGRVAGVPRQAVSYAGMKDRHAVAEQWFSLHLPGRVAPIAAGMTDSAGIEVLAAARHARKLHTGALAGNDFTITLRDCRGGRAALAARVASIGAGGVPNYFGEQRFGRDGGNLERARQMFAGGYKVRDRHLRGIYLSAARSWLFNAVLAERVRQGNWNRIIDGEAVMLAGSRSFFPAEPDDGELVRRLAEGDIHPSGPLWGAGEPPSRGAAAALEHSVAAAQAELAAGLAAAGMRQERRALRLLPAGLNIEWSDDTTVILQCRLPAGSFATVVVRELAVYRDAGGDESASDATAADPMV